jgi:uncharacterized iron-regulated membrane protein
MMRIISIRSLHLWHRWLGIVFGLLVLFWFISGLVMLYVPYPSLTQSERLSHLIPINMQAVKYQLAELVGTQSDIQPDSVRLSTLNHRPAYFFMINKEWQAIWADTGEHIVVDHSLLSNAAKAFMPSALIKQLSPTERDQWSLSTKYDAHRPLYLAEMDDELGSHLYLSGNTGEVLIDTTRQERAWNWLGSVIHWIYFTPLRTQAEVWRQIILWTSFFSFLLVGIGFWLGINRIRLKSRYKNNRVTPYSSWKKWHHLIGLAGGIFCMTWLLSGWLSVKPFDWISDRKLTEQEKAIWAGTPLAIKELTLNTQLQDAQPIKEMYWLKFAGETYALGQNENQSWLINNKTGYNITPFSHNQLIEQAKQLKADQAITSITALHHGDSYYRSSPIKSIVPVLRLQFDDQQNTSYYIDPNTSNIVSSVDDKSRLYRWLFHALHRLDVPPLSQFELPRQVVIWMLSAFGIVLTLAGVIIGLKRLNHKRIHKY